MSVLGESKGKLTQFLTLSPLINVVTTENRQQLIVYFDQVITSKKEIDIAIYVIM